MNSINTTPYSSKFPFNVIIPSTNRSFEVVPSMDSVKGCPSGGRLSMR